MTSPIRVPLDELERMAFTNGAEIEVDREESIAVATVAGVEFYSALRVTDGAA